MVEETESNVASLTSHNVAVHKKEPHVTDPVSFEDEMSRFLTATEKKYAMKQFTTFVCYPNKDLCPVIQGGYPMCGIVALTMAYQILNKTRTISDDLKPANVLKSAQSRGYTKQGEILSAQTLLSLSYNVLDCTGSVEDIGVLTPAFIVSSLISNRPIVVPYDCDKDHTPLLANGHQAHWCLIVGVVILSRNFNVQKYRHESEGQQYTMLKPEELTKEMLTELTDQITNDVSVYVIARHGKSRYLGFWLLDQLCESNGNLHELGPQRDSADFVLPNDERCLTGHLRSKFVVLKK